MENCARGAALATGADVDITRPAPAHASMRTNETLAGLCEDNAAQLGRHPVDGTSTSGPGSTDMGNVSRVVPAVHPCLQLVPELTMHTREAAEAAGSAAGDRVATDGAMLLALTAAQLFSRPELVAAAHATFEQRASS